MSDRSDDSDDEVRLLRNGRVDPKWYQNLPHLGYDIHNKPIAKGKLDNKIDQIIKRAEDPNWWRVVRDEVNNKDVYLTDQQLQIVDRVRKGLMTSKKIAATQYKISIQRDSPFPISNPVPSKKSFQPSKSERILIGRLVKAIKEGKLVTSKQPQTQSQTFIDIWQSQLKDLNRPIHVSAPKNPLPTTQQSYNPPPQYLLSQEQQKAWKQAHPQDRELQFIPRKYPNTRSIERYEGLVDQRFQRCLDLYLCPRIKKKRIQVDLQDILPQMPKPQNLRPFPTFANIVYKGHQAKIRSLCPCYFGNWLLSGDDSGLLILFDTATSRKLNTYRLEGSIFSIDVAKNVAAVGHGNKVTILLLSKPAQFYEEGQQNFVKGRSVNKNERFKYLQQGTDQYNSGLRLKIQLDHEVTHVKMHSKGDYFLTVCPEQDKKNQKIMVHCVSKASSQRPFSKSKGILQKAYFHYSKPLLIVMTRKSAFMYHLQKQIIFRKLISGADWNSSLALHPYGDIIVMSSFQGKLNWFDTQMSQKPFKVMHFSEKAIRKVVFHNGYPLFASCCDDGSIHILNVKVNRDSFQQPTIAPVKILQGSHRIKDNLGVLDIAFHPEQPWIFSSGSDHKIVLWT